MSAARTPKDSKRNVNHGGLPPDNDLDAFAAAAAAALPASPARERLSVVPGAAGSQPERPATASPPASAEAAPPPAPQPAAPQPPPEQPDDDAAMAFAAEDLIRQATINVGADVAERFRRYRQREGRNGPAPTNVEVVFRALDACDGRYSEIVAARMPQPAPGRRVGGTPVPGRRISTEARLASQINYRPTYGEVAEIRRLAKQAGARSVSALLDAVLDAFLPPLKRSGGSRAPQRPQDQSAS